MGSPEQLTRAGARSRTGGRPLSGGAAWLVLVVSTVSRAGLSVLLVMLLWAVLPAAFGMRSTVVMSASMAPAVQVGDVVVTRTPSPGDVRLGTVLLVDDPDHVDRLRLHRLVAVQDGLLRLRGDANPAPDSSLVRAEAVRGIAFLRVPFVGTPLVRVREGDWPAAAGSVALVGALLLGAGTSSMLPRAGAPRGPFRRRSAGRIAAAGVVGIVMVIAGPARPVAPAWAGFSAAAAPVASTFGAGAFSCLRTVGPATTTPPPTVAYTFPEPDASSPLTADVTGNANTGALVGNVQRVAGSCLAGAGPVVQFGAGGGGAVVDSVPMLSPGSFTVGMWVRTTTPGGLLAGFGSSGDATPSGTFDRQLVLNANGTVTFRVGVLAGITASVTTTRTVTNGEWHHVAATLAGLGAPKVYIDGVLAAQASLSLSLYSYPAYLRFGNDAVPGASSSPYQGLIAAPALWNGVVLNPDQIAAVAAAGH